MHDGDVTLVVAAYNHELFVDQCLASVARQTLRPRLIVADDASTDRTAQMIKRSLTRHKLEARTIFHNTNAGICRTFNEALDLVDTEFLAFISADDWLLPGRFEAQLEQFRRGGDQVALVFGDMLVVNNVGETIGTWSGTYYHGHPPTGDVFGDLLNRNFIGTPSVMLRTRAVRAVGGYDEDLPFEDLDMWLRLAREFEVGYTMERVVAYRVHETSMTSGLDKVPESRDTALETIFAKHLGAAGESDRIVLNRLFDLACRAYWRTGPSPKHADISLRYAKHFRSIRGLGYWFLHASRLPLLVVRKILRRPRGG